MAEELDAERPVHQTGLRSLRLIDLMTLVAAAALTLSSPRMMKGIIPAGSLPNWDRRSYVAHLITLVMLLWTAILVVLMRSGSALAIVTCSEISAMRPS